MPLIFILDDDRDMLFTMEFWLKKNGYSVKSFVNANQLLKQLQETTPDVILLDIHLNGEDGREICRYLKTNKMIDKKVFLMTVSSYTDTRKNYTDYHADGFVQKPYHMKELPAMIQRKLSE